MEQAFGELIKMSLIGTSRFFDDMAEARREAKDLMWRFLKFCIEDKYEIILQDPFETKKIRQVLNFGHTMGHVFESHFDWPHGDSVLQGIFFALEWSRYKDLISQQAYNKIIGSISEKFARGPAYELNWYRKPGKRNFLKLIQADKKIDANGNILFVFLKGVGRPHLKLVLVDDLISEAVRQGWAK